MEFTPRIRDILLLLMQEKEPLTKQEIAARIGVSKRTVQREFEYIEQAISEYGLFLVQKKGSGITISGSEENKDQVLKELAGVRVVGPDDKEERRKKILFVLLKDRTPKKLFYFGNMLGVSEVTAASDLDAIKPWLDRYDLKLVKKPGYGVTIDGEEEDFRRAMRRFIADNGAAKLFQSNEDVEGEAVSEAILTSIHKQSIYSLLKQDTVDRVQQVLKAMEEPALSSLADNSYMGLIIHIAIAVERIKKGGILNSDQNKALDQIELCEESILAEKILREMEEEFEIQMPRAEISYLMLHLRASKTAYHTGNRNQDLRRAEPDYQESENLMNLIDRMVDIYNPEYAYEMKSDEDFLEGLIMHLRPVLVRLEHHLDIYNPMLEDIKTEYPDVFERCRQASEVLKMEFQTEISEEEIGFLAMHFGAAEEKIRNQIRTNRKVYIGVVCAGGFGLARLMVARIRDHIDSNMDLNSYGREELTPYVISKNDFFVSSFDLSEEGVDFVRVKPLITQADVAQIKAKISQYAHIRRKDPDEDFARQLDAANYASREIKGLIQRYHHYQVAPKITFDEILRYLAMMSTTNLRDAGKVIEAVKKREEINTQVFEELGICLFHCRTDAVQAPLFLSCTPKKQDARQSGPKGALDAKSPVPATNSFLNPYFKGTRAAVLLLMPEDEHQNEHKEMLGYISASFIRDDAFMRAFDTGEEEQIKAVLVKMMKKYFSEILEKM